jgi:signal transduction histidine kinase
LNWAQQIKLVLATGKTKSFDRVSFVSNGKVKLLRIVCTPNSKSKTQKNLGGSILIEDITEKVSIQKELTDAERLAAIGRHTSKIAHELSSPLDGILRYIGLATRIVEQENLTKPKEYLDRCRQALLRMVQIVSELLEFSRGGYEQLERANIEQIIEDAVKIIAAKAEASNIKISRNYTSGLPQIRVGNLFHIFCNIIKNAFEAMSQGGELYISTCLVKDNTVVAEFRDTGKGFAPENAEVMFEPFFTTKEKGTGLGLAICRDIIDRYHGQITAENATQGGSIFRICLPLDGIL